MTSLPDRMYWSARGYYAFPLLRADEKLDDFEQWKRYARFVEAAKAGGSAEIPPLLDTYDHDADWVRRGAYVQLMGDAGPDGLLEHIHGLLHSKIPYDYALDFMETIFYWGRLDVVPTLIEAWRTIQTTQDADYIPPRLNLLIDIEPIARIDCPDRNSPEEDAETYRQQVLERHAALRDEYGERAFVFRGRLLDIEWIIRCALADLAKGELDPEMRHKIEAMTGIDCSCFYHREALQPLAAAALLEDMLASLDLFPFVPGQRYFFGHPVP